jgi:5-(carboxyamino)imidazole ribonucleotide mutase
VKKFEVAVIMGSQSDFSVMKSAIDVLKSMGIAAHAQVISAHRGPQDMVAFALGAAQSGFKVIIAGAGGAAHLPGMVASLTTLPVIGVPIETRSLKGLDSLLSIAQMPKGVPVATMAINNAENAGLLAARILAVSPRLSPKSQRALVTKLAKHQSALQKLARKMRAR